MLRTAGFVIGILTLIAFADICLAQIYKYIDENGRVVFVDNVMKIPEQYRQKKTVIPEQPPQPTYREDNTATKSKALDRAISRKQTKEKARKRSTKVEIKNNQILVPVEIFMGRNKAKLKLLLDTGAGITLLHERSLKDFDIREYETGFGQQASGSFVATKVITLTRMKVGPFKEKGMTVHLIAYRSSHAEYDGLLGMDFLSKHKYAIDYDKQLLHWD